MTPLKLRPSPQLGPGQFLILAARLAQTCRPFLRDSCGGPPKLVVILVAICRGASASTSDIYPSAIVLLLL
eukprot:scaffold237392_cov31-Tisochrysis_lutea.AAC.1